MEPYSNRELDFKFTAIMEKLEAIHEQTVKTNGRVNSLEFWMQYMKGGMAIIGLILVPLLLYMVTKYI